MGTRKTTRQTRTKLTTSMADLGSVVRLSPNNFNSSSFSFVSDKTLQLEETPIANPIVHSLSSSLFPYTFEVFHDYLVSIEVGNNIFTDIVVVPSHKPLLFSTQLLEKSSGTSCAFGLKFTTQVFELSFNLFDFTRIIKPAVRSDSEVVYSAIDAQNYRLGISSNFDINCFRECEQKEASAFFINTQETFSNIPTEVFFITVRDSEWNFNSAFDCSKTQDIVLKGSRTREVVSHRTSVNNWFGFSLLDHSASLFNTSDGKLALQSRTFESWINKMMQFDVVPNSVIPSSINAELQSFGIDFESINYLLCCSNLDFSSCSDTHSRYKTEQVYKCIGGEFAFLPSLKALGIQANMIL
jgi:hypothetical protein